MKNKNNILLLLLLSCLGCTSYQTEKLIENEYLRLSKKSGLEIIVNDIELLEIHNLNFIKLANIELDRLDSINKLNAKLVNNYLELDSLFSVKIKNIDPFDPNDNLEHQQNYIDEIVADSLEIKSITSSRLKTQIEILETENKAYEILNLSNLNSIHMTDNLWIKHKVNMSINNKSVNDTLVYVSFNNGSYWYLSANPFINL